MNPEIKIKRNDISHDQGTGRQFYAHTNKGIIYGSTYEICQRKVERAKAGPWVLIKDKPREVDPEHEYDVPF